jgi:hypothetical protein
LYKYCVKYVCLSYVSFSLLLFFFFKTSQFFQSAFKEIQYAHFIYNTNTPCQVDSRKKSLNWTEKRINIFFTFSLLFFNFLSPLFRDEATSFRSFNFCLKIASCFTTHTIYFIFFLFPMETPHFSLYQFESKLVIVYCLIGSTQRRKN